MISIIIPTCNSAKTIKRCLDSIIAQTCKDFEVLVMDGLSKDDTLSLVQSYNDSRIHIYSEPDKGIYDAMNKGILKSKGEWLYFLGSDDYLYKSDVLEKIEQNLSKRHEIVYGEVEAPQLQSEYKGAWNIEQLEYNRCHQAIFYQRSIFEEYGMYDLSYKLYADYIYNLNAFWKYHVSTKHVNVVVAHYSAGGASASGEDPQFVRDINLIYLQLGKNVYPIKKRKELAWNIIRNTDSRWMKFKMKMYIYYLRCVAKCQSLLPRKSIVEAVWVDEEEMSAM